jgi:hypothetical protein
MKHDPYGPSTHPMLVKCPAYSSTPGETVHTVKGTEKHKYVEMFLDPKSEYYDKPSDVLYELMGESNDGRESEYVMDANDISNVVTAVDQARSLIEYMNHKCDGNLKVHSEQWVDLAMLGISGGTPDLVLTANKTIVLIDFKFGRSAVSPQSEQLLSYMCGLNPFDEYDHMYTVIIQPLVYDEAEIFEVSKTHLNKHLHMMKDVIDIAKLDNPPFLAHSKCSYCSKHLRCPATVGSMHKANEMVARNKEIQIYNIPNESLELLVKQYEKIKSFGGALKQELFTRLHRGEEMSGYELGSGRRSRVWRSEEDAVERLKELCNEEGISPSELYDTKIMSVAKVEKLLAKRKKDVAQLFTFVDGKVTLKPKK